MIIVDSCIRNCQPGTSLQHRLTSESERLFLSEYLPFRLNRLAAAVSEYLAEIYREEFDLDIPAWRVLVTVASQRGCNAQYVVRSTRMHKTRVSRAIVALEKRGLIQRAPSSQDAREMLLRLTARGRRLHARLVPVALTRERALLACLDSAGRRTFLSGLSRLEVRLALAAE
jgi:DNA-binding MarR family transcriptional regulator